MKKIWLTLLALIGLGMTFTITTQPAQAANRYGRGKIITTPKNIRGTWYSYDRSTPRKVVIKTHTINGKKLYKQNAKIAYKDFGKDTKFNRQMSKASKNWLTAYYQKFKGKKYFTYTSWITFEGWNGVRPATVSIKGKKHKILAYSTFYTGGNLYKTKKLAKTMKNHIFKGVTYTL